MDRVYRTPIRGRRPASARAVMSSAALRPRAARNAIIHDPMKSSLQVAILAAGRGQADALRVAQGAAAARRPTVARARAGDRAQGSSRARSASSTGTMRVREQFPDAELIWARQDPPRGTGDALRCALRDWPPDGVTLVLFGADPLARARRCGRSSTGRSEGVLSLLTVELDDPSRLRPHRSRRDGNVRRSSSTRMRRLHSARSARSTRASWRRRRPQFARWLQRIDKRNASGEYYLTDVIAEHAVSDGVTVTTHARRDRGRDDGRQQHARPRGARASLPAAACRRAARRQA